MFRFYSGIRMMIIRMKDEGKRGERSKIIWKHYCSCLSLQYHGYCSLSGELSVKWKIDKMEFCALSLSFTLFLIFLSVFLKIMMEEKQKWMSENQRSKNSGWNSELIVGTELFFSLLFFLVREKNRKFINENKEFEW